VQAATRLLRLAADSGQSFQDSNNPGPALAMPGANQAHTAMAIGMTATETRTLRRCVAPARNQSGAAIERRPPRSNRTATSTDTVTSTGPKCGAAPERTRCSEHSPSH